MDMIDAWLFWLMGYFADLTMVLVVLALLALTAAGVWLHTRLDARFGYSRRAKDLDYNIRRALVGSDRYGHAGIERGNVYATCASLPGFNTNRNRLRGEEYDAALRRLTRRHEIYESGFRRLALKPKLRGA